ncbi:unnamed protein product [Sympodiomycopsis kandeliae]
MPLVLPDNPLPDSAVGELEPSTLALEIQRLETSIAKLKESNTSLTEFSSSDSNAQPSEKDMYRDVIVENQGVIEKQETLLAMMKDVLESKGGTHAAINSDPHLQQRSQVESDLTESAQRVLHPRDQF